jgi:hypothetical protein
VASQRVWVPITVSLRTITEDRQVRDSHTGTMWAAGDEPVFKDGIKLGYIEGVTQCHLKTQIGVHTGCHTMPFKDTNWGTYRVPHNDI